MQAGSPWPLQRKSRVSDILNRQALPTVTPKVGYDQPVTYRLFLKKHSGYLTGRFRRQKAVIRFETGNRNCQNPVFDLSGQLAELAATLHEPH